MLAALRQRRFALLWSGQSLSAVGNRMFPVILAVVVLDRHSGAMALGLVLAVQSVAMVAGTALAAAVVDRCSRRALMLGADLVRALGVAALAHGPDAAVLPLVVAIAMAEGLFQPAYAALVPRVLPAEHLQAGNSLTSLSQYAALITGPSLAGAVIAAAGTTPALWIDVATFAGSLATLLLIHETPPAQAAPAAPPTRAASGAPRRPWSAGQAAADVAEAAREVANRPWLAASMGASTLVMAFAVAPMILLAPIVADARLGGPRAYGAAFTALGAGAILGALIASRIRTRRPGLPAVAGLLAIAGALLSLAVLPLPGVLVLWGVAGAGITVFEVLWTTAVQRDVPDGVLGRVMALDWLGSETLTPLGYLLAGAAVTSYGTGPPLLAAACAVVLAAPLPLLVRGGAAFTNRPRAPSAPATGPLTGRVR
ncbi:MFS transporter [Actinomadura viridis]|uniref:MFS family arabinose efflux permease n=1 Tax=Actinomadura viridis TaxID=58110 RepID=A0A931DM99_9ACTN|nr:MFS transporter [Actinomadura viridis]MBG6092575.1 putative MFS family arabinose efflux permease [Actinomadura viridis]